MLQNRCRRQKTEVDCCFVLEKTKHPPTVDQCGFVLAKTIRAGNDSRQTLAHPPRPVVPAEHTNRQKWKILQIRCPESGWGRTSTGSTGKSLRTTQRTISGDWSGSLSKRTFFFIWSTRRQLRVNEEHSDLSLACEDGQQFDVHKLVLSACSPFFQVAGRSQNY